MNERIGAVFHWSPIERREAIRSGGLKPYSPAVNVVEPEEWAHGFGVICCGVTPSGAWRLSGGMDQVHTEDITEGWDLWQVTLDDNDEIAIRSEFGPFIWEVRVRNPIPADRVWWVGQRG